MPGPTLDLDAFVQSLDASQPPITLNMALRALWFDAKDKPESALRAARADPSLACLRVLAYLQRKSGQDGAARVSYWKAGATPWEGDHESEWRDIVQSILVEFPVASAYGA